MTRLAIYRPPSIDAASLGSALAADLRTLAGATEGALFVSPVRGDAFVLGAHQRAASTLDLARAEVRTGMLARRTTGGVALHAREGQIFVALDLASASVLGGNGDPARAINRHVRPLLAALSGLGIPATYGGRDFALAGSSPVAWVGVTHERARGTVGLEMLLAVDAPFGIDPTLDLAHGAIAPRWLGKTPGTLTASAHRTVSGDAIADAIVRTYAQLAGGETREADAPSLAPVPAPLDQPPFAALVEEGMGLIGAAIEPGVVSIGGELMVSRDVLPELGKTLHALVGGQSISKEESVGVLPASRPIEHAIDQALGPASGAMLFGVKSLASIAKVVRAALARA